MSLGLVGALAAALCYGVASVLQAVAVARTSSGAAVDPRLLGRLLTQGPYLAGVGLDGVGFVASLLALRSLPLFLVESAVASSIGVTAVLAARFLHLRLHRVEWLALGAVGTGLVLLAAAAQPDPGRALSARGGYLLLAGVAVSVAVGAISAKLPRGRAGALLAADSGLAFGAVGIAARSLVVPDPLWHLVGDPVAWSLVAYGLLGMLWYSAALQRASVTTATAITFAVETTVPALVGLTVLGDSARPGFGPVAVAGFVVALGGCLTLARRADL